MKYFLASANGLYRMETGQRASDCFKVLSVVSHDCSQMNTSRTKHMSTLAIYCTLPIITALYALLLSRLPKRDPDFTWFTVIVGVAICLVAPALDQRQNGPLTSEVYEWRVWQAFLLGGAPIVIWRISATVRAYHRLLMRMLSRIYGNSTDQATPLASQRRSHQETDD